MTNWHTAQMCLCRRKRIFSHKIVTSRILVMMVALLFVFSDSAFAVKFSTSAYNKDIKIGLVNMSATKINITLSNYYGISVYDLEYTPRTSFALEMAGGKLKYKSNSGSSSSSGISISTGIGTCDEIVFNPINTDDTIKLEVGAKKYFYKGSIRFKVIGDRIIPINIIDVETYLKGVVGYEMSNSYPIEALKAQAIAARNYALTSINKHGKDGYDLCDTTDCQVYKGSNSTYLNVIKAVDETKGKVLVYGDEFVGAYYSASCGGYTEASGNIWSKQLPYLIAKKDEYENDSWPYGTKTFTTLQMDKELKAKKFLKQTDSFVRMDLASIKKNESGRVSYLELIYLNSAGAEVKKTITKEAPRTFLSLPSSLYNVVYDLSMDTYTFSGMGYGHGVGMSQVGAKNRAKAGQTCEEILNFYYDGSKVVNMSNAVQKDDNSSQYPSTPIIDNNPSFDGSTKIPSSTTESGVEGDKNKNVDKSKDSNSNSNSNDVIPPSKSDVDDSKTTQSAVGINSNSKSNNSINVIPKPNGNAVKINTLAKIENYNFTRELKKGMKGDDVKKLQDLLKKLKYFNVAKTTTYFGAATETSIKTFQKKQGIKVNGVADKNTLTKLGKTVATIAANSTTTVKATTKATTKIGTEKNTNVTTTVKNININTKKVN